MTLPAGSAGAIVSVADYANSFQTNALTITPNGSEKINGGAGAIILSTEGQSLTLIYVDGTQGWKSVQDSTTNHQLEIISLQQQVEQLLLVETLKHIFLQVLELFVYQLLVTLQDLIQ
jgi:hypothetical protein